MLIITHTDSQKNNFLVLGEGPDGINDSTGAAKKEFILILTKQIQNFV